MALTVLNNISSMTAENALSNTQANLQKTLTQLSTGMKINSGSDDAAGLSIVSGLNANIAALTQSQQNASNGIGLLQTADGALSQVTTLLNRAVTLATEGATTGITSSQATALNTEFVAIKSEIDQIGQATNFNGSNVFTSNAPPTFTSTQGSVSSPLAATTALTSGSVTTITDAKTGGSLVFTAVTGSKISNLQTAITNAVTAGTLSAGVTATIDGAGQLMISSNSSTDSLKVSSNDAALGAMNANTPSFVSSSPTALNANSVIAAGAVLTITPDSGAAAVFTATNATTVGEMLTAINTGASTANVTLTGTAVAGTTAQLNGNGQLEVDDANGNISSAVTSGTVSALGQMAGINGSSNITTVYLGDGTTTGAANTQISTVISGLSAQALNLSSDSLTSSASATQALLDVTAAINTVSAQRGVIGASVNRLTAATSNMANQVTNLQSAANGLQNADIGKTVANMTQYNVLQSTGMAALQQSNQAKQAVLKLVQ